MKPNVVSVIIPVYNGEQFIAQALESVFAQDYRPLEVIVVDDGSTDQTPALVQQWKDVRYIRQENKGESIARNHGIEAAQGEFIAFLDADDLWMPAKLTSQIQFLLQHPEYEGILCNAQFFLEPGQTVPAGFRSELLKRVTVAMIPSALVVCRGVFAKVGLFNQDYKSTADTDWFARARDHYVNIGVVPDMLLRKRVHASNISSFASNDNLIKVLHGSILRKQSGSK